MKKQRVDIARREFLISTATAGAGLSLGMYLPLTGASGSAQEADTPEINAWVVIEPDDTVIIRIARSEMGQGTLTGLAQMVAEELECDWSRVTTEYPTPGQSLARDRVWGSFATGGSQGIRGSHSYVRKGGAAARHMLIEAAAEAWEVPMEECRAANSVITHTPTGRKTTYGKVASAAAELFPPEQIELKDPKDWKLIGRPVKRLDTADKLNGKQVFGADLQMPGMLNAAIRACPTFGGKLKSFDDAKVREMPGVRRVVRVNDDAVAVVAETWWQAKTALDALPITWDKGSNAEVTSASIARMLEEGLTAEDAFVGNEVGNAGQALKKAAKTVSATYSYPYQNHATMEPMNATARWTPERCEVWCPTQNGELALQAAAEAAGLPPSQCEVYKLHLGGGFGRRGAFHDFVRQAVAIAKQMPDTPVKLLWTREEDMQHGHYHPITMARLVGGLDEQGNLTGLHIRISGQSILAAVNPNLMQNGVDMFTFQGLLPEGDHAISYSVPNLLVDHAMRNPPIPPGFWRGVNINQNAVYMESFIDELAHAAGTDPLEFRRKLMIKHPKSLAVLDAVAEMPKVEVIVMPTGGFWGGIGEPTIAVAAPAVLNAIFAATGKPIRRFPLKNEDLRPT